MVYENDLTHQPVTPSVMQEWILSPASYLELRIRELSQRAADLETQTVSLYAEAALAQIDLAAQSLQAGAKLGSIQSYLSSPNSTWMRVSDTFLDTSNTDSQMTQGIQITPHEGVGLAVIDEKVIDVASLSIVRGQGNPGNNLEVSTVAGPLSTASPSSGSTGALAHAASAPGQEPTVSFSPVTHGDLSAVLTANDTLYFDWERIYVPPTQRTQLQGTAYVHTQAAGNLVDVLKVTSGFGWTANINGNEKTPLVLFAKPSDPLVLVLEADLGFGSPMSHLDITVRQVGGHWPTITSVTVSGDGQQWYELACQENTSWKGNSHTTLKPSIKNANKLSTSSASGKDILETSTWNVPVFGTDFPPVQYIQVALSQKDLYDCPKGIGHPYYVNVVEEKKSSSSWFGLSHSSSDNVNTTRLSGPEPLISMLSGQDTSSKTVGGGLLTKVGTLLDNPALKANPTLALVGAGLQVLGSIWGSSSHTTKTLEAGEYVDVFDGMRQCISVRQIKPVERQFTTNGSSQWVSALTSFDQPFSAIRLRVDESTPGGTTIEYYISYDNGRNWDTIQPTNLAIPASPIQAASLSTPQKTVRLKAILNTSDAAVTPRLYGYELECLPSLS